MEERKRLLALLLLMVMLVAVNALMGGPQFPSLPSEVTSRLPAILIAGLACLAAWGFIAMDRSTGRLAAEEWERQERAYERRKRIYERQYQIATDPNAPPETLKEQIERKKLGL